MSVEANIGRQGWDTLPAIQHRRVYELNSARILQPGFGIIKAYEELKFPGAGLRAFRPGLCHLANVSLAGLGEREPA